MKKIHNWTSEEKEILRSQYNGTYDSLLLLSNRFAVSPIAIKAQIHYLGLAKRRISRWTADDDEKLAELVPQYSPRTIAIKMHRGISAIVARIKKLHYSRRERDGWFTQEECCEILGVDRHWLQRKIKQGLLKVEPRLPNQPVYGGNACWMIKDYALREFIIQHPLELQGRIVDLLQIVHLILDKLPESIKNNRKWISQSS